MREVSFYSKNEYTVSLEDIAFIKVGGVSGADDCFIHPDGMEFVCSQTRTTEKQNIIYNQFHDHLLQYKESFSIEIKWRKRGGNGVGNYVSEEPRVYVNGKTRTKIDASSDVNMLRRICSGNLPKFSCSPEILRIQR